MVLFQVTCVFIATFVISNAFYVPPNAEGPGFGEHFLNQKLSFLENKLKQQTENTEQSDTGENIAANNMLQQKLAFLENKFKGAKFDFIKQKIEAKQQARDESEAGQTVVSNKDLFDQKLAFLQNLLADKMNSNHQISKRSTKNTEEGESTKDPAIGNYFLNQKLTFLQNKFKDSLVDFDAIKEKIEAKKEAKKQEEAAITGTNPQEAVNEKWSHLLNFLKQLHAEKVVSNHQVAKRSIKPTEEGASSSDPAFGATIGQHFLNQKLTFLENKFKGTLVDFDTIKEKIQAKKEAKLAEEAQNAAVAPVDDKLKEKLVLMQNFLKQLSADQLATIIEKIEGKHSVAKRSIKNKENGPNMGAGGAEYGAAIRDHFLKQKFDFLDNKFKQVNVNSEALKQKIQSKQKGAQ